MRRQHLSLNSPVARAVIVLALLAVIGIAALFFRRSGDGEAGPTLEGAPSPGAAPTVDAEVGPLDGNPPVLGQPAPDFALRDLDGRVVTLSELRGKVVFINFWATWCRPCKKELPDIQKIADAYPDDLVVLAINWRDGADDARAYFEESGLRLRVLLDGGGVYDQYKLRGLPNSFFVDREGNLAEYQIGQLSESEMRERLADAGLE